LLQSSTEYLQEFHGSLTTLIFHTWHGKFLQSDLEAKWENIFSIFQEWCPFLDEKCKRDAKKKEGTRN